MRRLLPSVVYKFIVLAGISIFLNPVILTTSAAAEDKQAMDNLDLMMTRGREGNVNAVKGLVEQFKVDVNGESQGSYYTKGWAPLSYSLIDCRPGTAEVVRYLISQGANIHKLNHNGETPLTMALDNYCIEAISVLLERGASANERNKGDTPIFKVIDRNSVEEAKSLQIIKLLESKGADLNMKDKDSQTPLVRTRANVEANIILYLISKGVDVSARDINGKTILIRAAEIFSGDYSDEYQAKTVFAIMKAAISAGVDVNAADENGQTALFKIIKRSNYEFTEPLIEFLLSSKADANIKDKSGTTILEEATRSKKIMGLLRKYGAQDTAKTIGL